MNFGEERTDEPENVKTDIQCNEVDTEFISLALNNFNFHQYILSDIHDPKTAFISLDKEPIVVL